MTTKISSTTKTSDPLVRETSTPEAERVDGMHIDPVIPKPQTELDRTKAGLQSYDESGPGIVHKGG